MTKRRTAGLALAAALLALLLLWNALTLRNAKELSAALEKAQAETAAAISGAETAESENVVMRSVLTETQAQLEAATAEAALTAKLCRLPRIMRCTVSHYCTELYPHICGTGNGITASGAPVQAGVSVAVDPTVIPLGSTVYVDYGDGVIHTYIAQDTGGAVKGSHIDVAVSTHEEASRLGMKKATIWWEEN